jgi:hypothetical protein
MAFILREWGDPAGKVTVLVIFPDMAEHNMKSSRVEMAYEAAHVRTAFARGSTSHVTGSPGGSASG